MGPAWRALPLGKQQLHIFVQEFGELRDEQRIRAEIAATRALNLGGVERGILRGCRVAVASGDLVLAQVGARVLDRHVHSANIDDGESHVDQSDSAIVSRPIVAHTPCLGLCVCQVLSALMDVQRRIEENRIVQSGPQPERA